jgi:hypothetical protein
MLASRSYLSIPDSMQRRIATCISTRGRVLRLAAMTAVFSSALSHAVGAQDCAAPATIAADRPGFLVGPTVLAKGSVQIESGWTHTRQSASTDQTVGSTLLRIPVSCIAELRVATGGYLFDRAPSGVRTSGFADAYLGTKIHLATGSGLQPQLGLFAGSSIPVGGAFSHHRAEPETDLSALWNLPAGQSLLAYGGIASRVAGDDRETERVSGASWGVPLGGRAASFLEVAEFARHDARTRFVTTGLQLFPRTTLQVDGFVSIPLHHTGSDVAVGLGIARRW